MKYDFDEIIERHDTNAVKWDICPDREVIPMWVADMDFKAAPFIMDAVRRRVEHGVFGYTYVQKGYYNCVCEWFERRRGWHIKPEWIKPISGIVPAITMVIQALTEPGDTVVFHSPAYNCFFGCPVKNGRNYEVSPLIYDESGDRPTYRMNFEDLDRRLADPKAKLFLLCNPQNPAGRIWTADELNKVGEICRRHGVTVISDEIHCELEMPGHKYVPFASLSEENLACSVTFCSPSKSFNIAGLEIANIVCSDAERLGKIVKAIEACEHGNLNPLGVEALQAAYSPEGEEWLDQLNAYLWRNYVTMEEMLKAVVPECRLVSLEGTYLAWLDCHALTAKGLGSKDIQHSLIETEKVWINNGEMYGDDNYMRINIACPHKTLVEGVSRMAKGLRRLLDAAE